MVFPISKNPKRGKEVFTSIILGEHLLNVLPGTVSHAVVLKSQVRL